MTPRRSVISTLACIFAVATVAALCACSERDSAKTSTDAGRVASLPAPGAAGGATGDPEVAPGKGARTPTLGDAPPPPPAPGEPGIATLGGESNPEAGPQPDPGGGDPLATAAGAGAAEPTPPDAVSVIRDYYAAINAREYPRAYALWAGGGSASRQTPEQFAEGFAQTREVTITVGVPGREDAGAGQRYIEVPVSLRATQADGSVHRFTGTYVLHRGVIDGATLEQRSWRIHSADLREATP